MHSNTWKWIEFVLTLECGVALGLVPRLLWLRLICGLIGCVIGWACTRILYGIWKEHQDAHSIEHQILESRRRAWQQIERNAARRAAMAPGKEAL